MYFANSAFSPLHCAIRFWSLEPKFVFVFIIFFFALCALGLSPFNRKSLPGRAASGSSLQRAPRPAPGPKSRLVRARGCGARKKRIWKQSNEAGGGVMASHYHGAARRAGFMPGPGAGMKRTDARKWLPGSLGSFDCRERSGAFDLAARARVEGRGKRQVKKRSGAAAGESSQGSATGRAESETFEASSFKGNQTAQSPRKGKTLEWPGCFRSSQNNPKKPGRSRKSRNSGTTSHCHGLYGGEKSLT
jgi:hypothetical protein